MRIPIFILLIAHFSYLQSQVICGEVDTYKVYSLSYECNSVNPSQESLSILDSLLSSFFKDSTIETIHFLRFEIPGFINACEAGNNCGYRRIEYLSKYLREKYQPVERIIFLTSEFVVGDTLKQTNDFTTGLIYTFPPRKCD